jgi:hypothetical protein
VQIDAREHRGETILTLHGSFDPSDALELHGVLSGLDPTRPATIDFHRVQLFHDAAVAALARELAEAPRVAVTGLSEHHVRLLRYFGVRDVERSP